MSVIPLAILFGEYAAAGAALAWAVTHQHHPSQAQDGGSASEDAADKDPDSGVAPDDNGPANPDGGIIPGTEIIVNHHGAEPYHTAQSLVALELRRQWAILRRAWSRTWRHIPWMSVTTIISVYKGYHIFLSVREALYLRRATIALSNGEAVPPETPLAVRKMMYLAHYGVNEGVRRGIKRRIGSDPFETPPPS